MEGTLYYESGAVQYVGGLRTDDDGYTHPQGLGVEYFEDGRVYKIGVFRRKGLECGCEFYPDGAVKSFARYRAKYDGYGPSFPRNGVYLAPDGQVRHIGAFKVSQSAIGMPTVVEPADYGSLMSRPGAPRQ